MRKREKEKERKSKEKTQTRTKRESQSRPHPSTNRKRFVHHLTSEEIFRGSHTRFNFILRLCVGVFLWMCVVRKRKREREKKGGQTLSDLSCVTPIFLLTAAACFIIWRENK